MSSRSHNLSLAGIPGIITGLIGIGYYFLLSFLINGHTTSSAGISLLPIHFFYLLIVGYSILIVFLLYFIIITINKLRLKKLKLKGNSYSFKKIRILFFIQFITFGIIAYYLILKGNTRCLIPTFLVLLGVFILISNRFTRGNTLIIGSLIILLGVLSFISNEYSGFAFLIGCGVCPVGYGLYYLNKF